MNRVAIIGGSGFIGSSLCKLFTQKKTEFHILDIKKSDTFPDKFNFADVRSADDLYKTLNFSSIIINLAAEHKDDVSPKSLYDDVNVKGAENICNIARLKNITKIIFTSSVAVYGFAPLNTDESGKINPFNDYGRTKWEAEAVYRSWFEEDPQNRTLVIIRPTVVFGEGNRGNVFNLLKQIASGRFVMIGNGLNIKSMAYVENVAAFISYTLNFNPGLHLYNYIDKPDFNMNSLVVIVNRIMGRPEKIKFRLPYWIGIFIGLICDFSSIILRKNFPISTIRVKKFCSNSAYKSSLLETGFIPPKNIFEAVNETVKCEFIKNNNKI
jgi:nucleoside-diphosphate-sugar epimerase